MNSYANPAKKTKAQRELERATALLRKPGARLMLMHTSNGAECSTSEVKRWFIVPGGPVAADIAAKLIERPDVCGGAEYEANGRLIQEMS
jgi:hypothetical protein